MRATNAPFRTVTSAHVRSGQTIFKNFSTSWWELRLECGHLVERRIRWLPERNGPTIRGFGNLHRPPSRTRLPKAPTRARCEECA